MAFADGRKSGGRKTGTPNRATVARQAQMARVNDALIEIGRDPLTGIKLLQEVLNAKDTPLDIRVQCAGLLIKHETAPETDHRYVAVMPAGVLTLDEWKEKFAKGEVAEEPKFIEPQPGDGLDKLQRFIDKNNEDNDGK